ncbi:hypothetical protein PanWU01x14_230040, partial [Parasponia andersonii]
SRYDSNTRPKKKKKFSKPDSVADPVADPVQQTRPSPVHILDPAPIAEATSSSLALHHADVPVPSPAPHLTISLGRTAPPDAQT